MQLDSRGLFMSRFLFLFACQEKRVKSISQDKPTRDMEIACNEGNRMWTGNGHKVEM